MFVISILLVKNWRYMSVKDNGDCSDFQMFSWELRILLVS